MSFLFRRRKSEAEDAAAAALRRAEQANAAIDRMLTAYSEGRAFYFCDLKNLEVGKEYEMDQAEVSDQPLLVRATLSTPDLIELLCTYPSGGYLGDHYHPDCDELVEVLDGSLVLEIENFDSHSIIELVEGDQVEIVRSVVHNARAGGSGCVFKVTFKR